MKVFVTWDLTLETLITFLTIENNNMNNYIVTFEYRDVMVICNSIYNSIYIFILQISLQLWLCKILSRLFQARQHKTTHKGTRQNVLVNVDLVTSQEQLQTNICVKCLGHWCLSINLVASRIGLICPQQNTKYNQEYAWKKSTNILSSWPTCTYMFKLHH